MKKKIIFFSGKRGGINHLIPIFTKLNKFKNLNLKFIFSDMHISKKFGQTILEHNELKQKIIKNKSLIDGDSEYSRSISISLGLKNNANIIKSEKPDLIVILGDRSELFSISIPAMLNSIPLLHLYGGDKTQGCTDESTRHAITMLSNYHVVSNNISEKNLIKFGINSKNIINAGLLSLHSFKANKIENKINFFKKNNLDINKKIIISILHPETWNVQKSKKKIINYFKIFNKIDENIIMIYPCSDPGYQFIIDRINKFKSNKNVMIFKNIKSQSFYNFLFYSDLLIGNSSSGILEAGYFNTKVLNIGDRQKNRYSKNVINVEFNSQKILSKVNYIISRKKKTLKKLNKSHIYFNENGLHHTINFIKKIVTNKNHNQILKLY